MKYSIYLMVFLFLVSCKQKKEQSIATEETQIEEQFNFNWLIGNWERIGEKEGSKTYEYWNQNDKGEYIGMGCTLKGLDTIWKEDVLIAKDGDGWNFAVIGMGDSAPTEFKITDMDDRSFVCENELNEFPKKIEYAYDGTTINAVISGGGPTIPFNFVRLKQ